MDGNVKADGHWLFDWHCDIITICWSVMAIMGQLNLEYRWYTAVMGNHGSVEPWI